jgi:sugar phosphate isomerase/epimerase
MTLGLMTRTLSRPTLEQLADAILGFGFAAVQLNLQSAGLPSLPDEFPQETAAAIGAVFASRGLKVAAVSASFNAIHPDKAVGAQGIRRVALLASRCQWLGANIITLCTGTRNTHSMWRGHPGNDTPEAWRDLLATVRRLLEATEDSGVTLAFEPEVVNVVNTADKARALVDEIASPRLRVLLDPANLMRPSDLADTAGVLRHAFALLAPYLVLAHAKDVLPPAPGEDECRRVAAGSGMLDYPLYLHLLRAAGYEGALILHDLKEEEIPAAKAALVYASQSGHL